MMYIKKKFELTNKEKKLLLIANSVGYINHTLISRIYASRFIIKDKLRRLCELNLIKPEIADKFVLTDEGKEHIETILDQ